MIDILIPVLARPANAQKVADSIDAATEVPHVTVFLCTRGDDAEIEACKATKKTVHLVDPGRGEYARKINAGIEADYGKADYVFLGADDLLFHPGWDRAAIFAHEASGRPVVGTQDLGNPSVMAGNHATHSLVYRGYTEQGTIDDPTRLLHEGYSHNWVDSEFIETAKARDCFVFAADSIVEHLHPFWRKGTDDPVYEKGRLDYHRDRRIFQTRKRLWTNARP